MAVGQVDEYRGKGGRDQQGLLARNDRSDGGQIERQGRALPERQGGGVGQGGQGAGQQQEERRVMPAVVGDVGPVEGGLLGRIVDRRIVGRGGRAVQRQPAGGPDVREVRAQGPSGIVDRAVRGRHQGQDRQSIGADQQQRIVAHALRRQPVAAPNGAERIGPGAARHVHRHRAGVLNFPLRRAPFPPRLSDALTRPPPWPTMGQTQATGAPRC